ncbi:MAG: hypothetical protein HQM11_05075 [SAR324 cluster bacterium]|nr:hypothetical protein [SAR324 cluster bacterium]
MALKSAIETHYEKEDSGKVVFEERKDALAEISKYLELLVELKKSKDLDKALIPALDEIHFKLESLKFTDIPEKELHAKIKKYTRVPLGEGKFMHLSAFLSGTGEAKVVKSQQEYLDQVQKMIKNTMGNLTNLLIFKKEDEHLQAFFDDLQSMNNNTNYEDVKTRMDHLTMSGIIKHYNQIKLDFLKNWLAPFQAQLNKPIEQMTAEDMQGALHKVDGLKKKELEELGVRVTNEAYKEFRPYNRVMHELMNGKSADFWGSIECRDEFVDLMQKIINRFSFKLENHFLVFEMADKSIAYMIGFPDDAFKTAKKLKDGRTGMTPHMKVFFQTPDKKYKEMCKENAENTTQFYKTLRTAVVPFLSSMAMILGVELSQELKDVFEIWI